MVIRKDDFSDYALGLGMWETLCSIADIDNPEIQNDPDTCIRIVIATQYDIDPTLPRG